LKLLLSNKDLELPDKKQVPVFPPILKVLEGYWQVRGYQKGNRTSNNPGHLARVSIQGH